MLRYVVKKAFLGGEMFINISTNLKKLAKYFPENLYVVGGYVRNQILGIESGDVDLASSVNIEEVANRLKDTNFVVKVKNLKMGAISISVGRETYEYTAFRKEVYEEVGTHYPSKVVPTDKIEEDSQRRDLSINAIYYNINKDEVVDYYQGIIDLKQRLIRSIRNAEEIFSTDSERILRMVRIAGELNFKIETNTLKTAMKYAKNLEHLQGSRKLGEIEKILYCDKRYNLSKNALKRALELLNDLQIWQYFGLGVKKIKYKKVYEVEDRFLGLLIDIVDSEKPECLEEFLEEFLTKQFAIKMQEKIFDYLSGYYYALEGLANKEYFFKYYKDWAFIYPLLCGKTKRIQTKYNFFYQYIIEHGLVIATSDLAVDENDIKKNFKNIDKRSYTRILKNLLSKVFDGKLKNEKRILLAEIEKNLQNY